MVEDEEFSEVVVVVAEPDSVGGVEVCFVGLREAVGNDQIKVLIQEEAVAVSYQVYVRGARLDQTYRGCLAARFDDHHVSCAARLEIVRKDVSYLFSIPLEAVSDALGFPEVFFDELVEVVLEAGDLLVLYPRTHRFGFINRLVEELEQLVVRF